MKHSKLRVVWDGMNILFVFNLFAIIDICHIILLSIFLLCYITYAILVSAKKPNPVTDPDIIQEEGGRIKIDPILNLVLFILDCTY